MDTSAHGEDQGTAQDSRQDLKEAYTVAKSPPHSIIDKNGNLTPEQAYQLEVQRGERARAAAAKTAARMGGPQRPISPPPPGGSVVVDHNGMVVSPLGKMPFGGVKTANDPGFNGLQDPTHVRAIQQFLVNHGYKIAVDGIAGPLTKAAIADFSGGVHGRNPEKFNAAHNLAPTMASTTKAAGMSPAHTGGSASATPTPPPSSSGGGLDPTGVLGSMLSTLMNKGVGIDKLIPTSFASDASAPDTALAQSLQDQLDKLPNAKAQALADIANWYGQVGDAATKAGQEDQTIANAGASSASDLAKGIMSSLGGSAMAGNNMIGSEGANDAATLKAMGANDAQLASDLGPIFKLQAAGDKSRAAASFDNQKTTLSDQLAQALGQASADKANALMQILDANNKSRQENFGDESSLLNTLAGLQISGVNATTKAQSDAMLNALRASEIAKNTQKSKLSGTFAGATPSSKAKVAQAITQALVDTNTGKLKSGLDWPGALRAARNIVRTNGWDPTNPQVVRTIIGPALSMAGVSFQNPQALYQP